MLDKKFLKSITPKPLWRLMGVLYYRYIKIRYRVIGRRPLMRGETTKAKLRRLKKRFFEKYCKGYGLDIGYGGDSVVPNCRGWDIEHGDAQYLHCLKDKSYDFVYSSHTLEHMDNPLIALKNWWRILKSMGYLILYIPDRDLYEKKKNLPSLRNPGHKCFFLLDRDEPPDTIGIIPLIQQVLNNFQIVYAKRCHLDGEFSIEVVIQKLK